jgi:addiction module HigA family antidote
MIACEQALSNMDLAPMTTYPAHRPADRAPMHPGTLLREDILPALKRSKTEIAGMLGISRQTLHDLLAERQPVTPNLALRLGKLCGNGPNLWLNLQRIYDLHVERVRIGSALDAIPTLKAA